MQKQIETSLELAVASLPPILDLNGLQEKFQIRRNMAYQLAAYGEIQSLTLGAPGKRGKRMFLTQSVVDYVQRRLDESKPLNCHSPRFIPSSNVSSKTRTL